MLETTAGSLLVDEALPGPLKGTAGVLDKKGTTHLLERVANEFPEQYPEISKRLLEIGVRASSRAGGFSFGLHHLATPKAVHRVRAKAIDDIDRVLADRSLSSAERDAKIIAIGQAARKKVETTVMDDSRASGNPLAGQVDSGARGKPGNIADLVGMVGVVTDHRQRPLPMPIFRNYAEGLDPAEHFAGSFAARKNLIDVKLGVQTGGAFAKQLIQADHRQVVTADDDLESPSLHTRGMPVATEDHHNEGSLLSYPVGGYPRNTVLTPRILKDLAAKEIHRIVVRSPIAGGSPEGGLLAKDVGMSEHGTFSPVGDMVGVTAAEAISEPIAQQALDSKHRTGDSGPGGLTAFRYLTNPPASSEYWAAHAKISGKVQQVKEHEAGGHVITVNGVRHRVSPGQAPTVHVGHDVESGDVLSNGLPNPRAIVLHKGIGEGRRYWTHRFQHLMEEGGLPIRRRNLEVIARGLINHVHLNDEVGEHAPGDVVPYDGIEASYEPRPGHRPSNPRAAIGRHLEVPVLHYTIGTKVTPSVAKTLEEFGVKSVVSHPDPPPFEPIFVGAQYNLTRDPDWMTRQLGTRLESGFLEAAHRARTSDPEGTSYVPSLSRLADFGEHGLTKEPKTEGLK